MAGCSMTGGLVEAENRKGSGMTTGILEAGSTRAEDCHWCQKRYFPEILIPS